MTPDQAFAFVEALVAYRQSPKGVAVPASADALIHLQGALGRKGVPYEFDLDDIQDSISSGFLLPAISQNNSELGHGLRRLRNLADYLIEAGTAIKQGIAEPEEWFKRWQGEEDKRRLDKEAYERSRERGEGG